MSHITYREAGAAVEVEVDYVVVGSGAGGATVAVELARGGARVAVVEAGAWRDPKDYPTSMGGAMRDMMDVWSTTLTRGRVFWPVVQACVAGGTTVINSAIVVRTPADVFELWQREHGFGGDGLSDALWGYQDEIEREIHVSPVPPASAGVSNDLAAESARRVGFEGHVMDRNVKDCLGRGQCLQGCKSERKQSLNLNYLPEVLSRGGHVITCAPAARILFDGRRAVGVTGRFRHPVTRSKGAEFRVRATKGVVVAASATRTPVLLIQSGVKHRALGEYFRAHPGVGVLGVYDQVVRMDVGATQGWASVAFRESQGLKIETLSLPLELVASRLSGGGAELMRRVESFDHLAHWVVAVRADAVGRVRPGWFGAPSVHYSLGPRDMQRFKDGVKLLAKMHFAVGAKAIITGVYGVPYSLGPDELSVLDTLPLEPRAWTSILSHLFGGAVMGADPERSVCDPKGRVRGYERLVVADASAIPTTLGVNPQHTIMALSKLRARELLDA
jgi:choline dehydrogenase-like flavoprotein